MTPRKAAAKDGPSGLDNAIAEINKIFGDGSIFLAGSNQGLNVESISTGILSLDYAIGVGGLPKGRIIEIYGPQMSGKTTLTLNVIREAQQAGGVCAFIDAEHSLDPKYARQLGVDWDALLMSQPDTGEQAFEIMEMLIETGEVAVVVVDSVAALTPRAEIEGGYGNANVGLHARLMSQSMRKLAGIISKSNTLVIFINQLREKIGVMFGSPEVTTGGRALAFYSSVRLDIRRLETLKDGDKTATANRTRARVVKNKVGAPYRECEFELEFGVGVRKEGVVLDMAVEQGIVLKSGAWFTYEGEQLGQGREKAKAKITSNPQLLEELTQRVKEALDATPE